MITLVIICRHGLGQGGAPGDKAMININTNGLENYCKQLRRKAEKASVLTLASGLRFLQFLHFALQSRGLALAQLVFHQQRNGGQEGRDSQQ